MKHFFLVLLFAGFAGHGSAQFSLSGTLRDTRQKPVAGVLVSLENTLYQTSSDVHGYFEFNRLPAGNYTLTLRSLGFMDVHQTLDLKANEKIIIDLVPKTHLAEEVTVSATRSGGQKGMAVQQINREEIEKLNTGQDLPYLLQLLPSSVITSDAGNGIGYTGIRIRGSDPSRINVTINGIPLNDAESQQVYWVNLPDFASSAENIEVTRGAGTSTNGAGAFGGSINVLSRQLNDSAFLESSHAFGSFNTLKNNLSFGTGLLRDHFSFEGRLSRISSDGYIDRASSDLKSYYFSGAYKDRNKVLRLNIFSGKEITYQSWYGVPESRIQGNRNAMLEYSIRNGLSEEETQNLLNSGRNYNYYTYDDQTDNYQQDHYQLLFSQSIQNAWLLNIALHATRGRGYYEEYKNGQDLNEYGIPAIVLQDTTITSSDLIRRRWLDNWFYGMTWSLQYQVNPRLQLTAGGAANRYDGDHFGEVIWARFAGNSEIRRRYYENNATKDDVNAYLKAGWQVTRKLNVFADVQYRGVRYAFTGPDDQGNPSPQDASLDFFNPKTGISYLPSSRLELYASVSVAHKEPNRDDYTESSLQSRPQAERLIDYEAGAKWKSRILSSGLNFYFMDYFDQLVLTGKINDVGSYTRSNIRRSYRSGVELQASCRLHPRLLLNGNLTFSENKIRKFIEYTDLYDADFQYLGQAADTFRNSTIAFSPSLSSGVQLMYQPFKGTEVNFILRYVSGQYLDNTENKDRSLPAYTVADIRLGLSPEVRWCRKLRFDVLLNNVFSSLYSSNGYTYGYVYDSTRIQENFYYPQAEFNVTGQVTLGF
ncbi:MAG: TonB-dependent receptor [Bacteroidia bacterium]|nr:TonB-dependent receptor [Bacteroidia bacterium]